MSVTLKFQKKRTLRTGKKSTLQHSLFSRTCYANFSKLMPIIHTSMAGLNAKMEYSLILRQCLEKIDATRFTTFYLVGDFNFPCIDWHSISPTSSDAHTLDFCSMLNDHFLVQESRMEL